MHTIYRNKKRQNCLDLKLPKMSFFFVLQLSTPLRKNIDFANGIKSSKKKQLTYIEVKRTQQEPPRHFKTNLAKTTPSTRYCNFTLSMANRTFKICNKKRKTNNISKIIPVFHSIRTTYF